MATAAQVLANQANAQHSTGPRTEPGKAKSAANSQTHGFTAAVMKIAPEDRPEFDALEKALIQDAKPKGALEMDALREFRDAAWRLRQIRKITRDHSGDPEAESHQLNRYRAAAEMSLHRALSALRDLQTIRLGRLAHLAKSENEAIGPLASPRVYAYALVDGIRMNRDARECFDEIHGLTNVF